MSQELKDTVQEEHPALGKRIISGGMILSVARVATKGMTGIVGLIIPRWLGPKEMGVFGLALLALGAIDALTQSGFAAAFMQRKTDYEKHILPVRTFNAFRGFLLGFFIFLAAPYVAGFMFPLPSNSTDLVAIQERIMSVQHATDVLRALSFMPVLTGLIPMIWILADKRLRFGYAAKYNIGMAALRLLVMLPLAWHLRTVWALVWGELIIGLAGVVVSTLMGREGRGFTFVWGPLKDLQGFGFWIFLSGVIAYVYVHGGTWLIGRLLDVQTMAVYILAFKFCTMFTSEAAGIINQMILPTFSHLQKDLPRLRSGFKKSFGILAMIVMGTGAVFCVLSHDYFSIVLAGKKLQGTDWMTYEPLFNKLTPWLALWGVCVGLSGAQSGVLQALGKPKWWLLSLVVMCTLMLALIWPAVHLFGAVGVAALLGGIGALIQVGRYAILARMLKLRLVEVLEHVVVPLGVGIAAVALATIIRGYVTTNPWGQAMIAGSVVAIVYVGLLLTFARFMSPNLPQLIRMILEVAKEKVHRRV